MRPRPASGARALSVLVVVALAAVAGACTSPSDAIVAMGCGSSRTFAYATRDGVDPAATSLDVHLPPAGDDGHCDHRPVVVWVHGGGWTEGDKGEYMDDKVAFFAARGEVLVSVNYRLTDPSLDPPSPQHPAHDEDVAAALAWVRRHAAEIGGDPDRMAVLGHSAGGGIAAAVATDPAYLGAHGMDLDELTCVASMDGEGYDVVQGASAYPEEVRPVYLNAFGTDPEVWAQASPIRHVAADTGIAPFLVFARGDDWRLSQHLAFASTLDAASVDVSVVDVRALEHSDLTTLVGAPGDEVVTPVLADFLDGCFAEG